MPRTERPHAHHQISQVFWVLLAIFIASGAALWMNWGANPTSLRIGVFLFVLSGWLVSLCFHEYAHARTALHGGDITVGEKGYLRLNPFAYSNALLSYALPVLFIILGGIGLPGGAVFIERGRIRSKWKNSLVSVAGPMVNLVCAAVLLVPLGNGAFNSAGPYFQVAVAFLGLLQVTATILNLLPVPGLDGYGIIEPWLSHPNRRAFANIAPYGMILVFVLLYQPSVNAWFFGIVYDVLNATGVSPYAAELGRQAFRFW